jgi:hypothetical protein
MKLFNRILYITLIVLNIFLAVSTILGGIGLMANIFQMPLELLEGSIFKNYTVPGLALAFIAGGSALFATVLLFRKSSYALLSSTTAGVIIMFFEFIEVLVIGMPDKISLAMQVFYFCLGTLIVVVSMGLWFLELFASHRK